MDRSPEVLFETLSAYVDGELSPDERARVAHLVASDEALARQVAMLQQMRAGVASLAPDAVIVPIPTPAPRRRLGFLVGLGLAASVAMAAMSAIWWGLDTPQPVTEASLTGTDKSLVLLHDGWLGSGGVDAVSASIGDDYAELLAVSGLMRVHDQLVRTEAGRDVHHSGYVGSNGCKLSLFRMLSEERMNKELVVEISAGNNLMKAKWGAASMRFVLLARKMDEGRFLAIVNAIREYEKERDRDADDLVAALEETRKPCLA